MKLVRISNVKPGEELAQSIISSEGNILLKSGIALNAVYINRLEKMGVHFIYVKDENLEDIEPEDPEFIGLKAEAIKAISGVFTKVQSSSKTQISDTVNIMENMVDYLTCNKGVTAIHLTELKTYDNYTFMHSLNSSVIGLYFGVEKKFTKNMLVDLGVGTILHDIGKVKVPHKILNKQGRLTPEEFEIMKKHPEYGYKILRDVKGISERAKSIVLQHHEKIDGTGYPYGVTGDKISYYAKIACISDVYDALVSDRVYRKGFPPHEAYEIIMMNSGKMLDPELVKIFQSNFSMYPLGVEVRLNNGCKGFVVGHNKGFPDRPIIRVLENLRGEKINPIEIDLLRIINMSITGVVV